MAGLSEPMPGWALRMPERELRTHMPPRKRITRKDLDTIERAAKRQAQKAAGALDSRYRTRVVKSRKTYSRKRLPPPETGEE
jgi:hypothetical protein